MADQPRTQKQIALKYKDNLDYFRHGHFLRRLRLVVFLLAILGSLGAVFGFRYWGKKDYFNTGPISQNHARFACNECHDGAEADLSRALKIDQAITDLQEGGIPSVDLEKLKAAGKDFSPGEMAAAAQRNFSPEKLSALQQVVIKKSSLAGMDRACLKCHEPFQLHQPQIEALKLKGVHPEMPLVHSDRCSTCHREHVGSGLMKLPGSETCASCHADLKELLRTRNVIKVNSPSPPVKAENRDLGDGLLRFIMPQEAHAQFAVIKNYADGHPAFRYEGPDARDPAVIKYNHQRHEQPDIPKIGEHKLACADCHQPKDGGEYYERVKYEKHCAACHSLSVIPEVPGLKVPHRDPAAVRTFAESLNRLMYTFLLNQDASSQGPSTEEAESARRLRVAGQVAEIVKKMNDRGIKYLNDIERRIFETGETSPNERNGPKANTLQTFSPCAKCHVVTPGNGSGLRAVTKTNIADRWVHHGPFTHRPHTHMSCDDCHGAAHKSTLTSDVLMPPQKICTECHSPLRKDKVMEIIDGGVAPTPGTPAMATKQRREGGVKWECQSCHKFHAPPESIEMIQASKAK